MRADAICPARASSSWRLFIVIPQAILSDVAYDFAGMLTRAALTDSELARGRTGFGGWCNVRSVSAMVEETGVPGR